MYKIKCEDLTLYDRRNPELIVGSPQVKLEVNTAGSASFNIYHNHPYYDRLNHLKQIFEISDDVGVIFRGVMPGKAVDIYKGKAVSLHGLMAFFNDSAVAPFEFPGDFRENADYISAEENGNVVEFFLQWLIDNHNSQVEPFQRFILGTVTVSDPNNYVTRSSEKIDTTWSTLKTKLFDSALGGYLCIRYESDGNYIDYLSEFPLTNTQSIEFGKNLLELKNETDASATYSAIIPLGATTEVESESGEKIKSQTTLASIDDGLVSDDVYKVTLENGLAALYSKSAVDSFGWKCAPVSATTWEDVGDTMNLLNKSIAYLTGTARLLTETIEVNAVDLHYTDEEIQSFRIYRNVRVNSAPHGLSEIYRLTRLDIDLFNPQNTKITVGATTLSLTDTTSKNQSAVVERLEAAEIKAQENQSEILNLSNELISQKSYIDSTSEKIAIGVIEEFSTTGEFGEFKKTTTSTFEQHASDIAMNFETTSKDIKNVNGDMQEKFNKLYKHISFSGENGIIISMGNGSMALQLDNDIISFTKNGQQFGWWDGVDFHTGNIFVDVEEQARFGNIAIIVRSDESTSIIKVGE